MDIDPLTALAIRHGTDKWGPHFYTPVYHELFSHLREHPVRLLEIGVGGHASTVSGGASLRMWGDYFPCGRIVGIDIAEKRLPGGERITILRGSQDDPAFLARVVADHGPFDIIIDDGSHRPAHVAASFHMLFPTLGDGGRYVIEDVQTAFWPKFGGSPADGADTMALADSVLRALNHAEIRVVAPEWTAPSIAVTIREMRAYHNLLVFTKGENREPSSARYRVEDDHVTRALAIMERELDRAPSPEGLAHLARNYVLARCPVKALDVVQEALARWPDHMELLFVGVKAASRSAADDLCERYLRRLSELAPEDPAVQALVAKAAASGER